jgi:hypothetical protein
MKPQTYFGYLDSIRHDDKLVQQEAVRLNQLAEEIVSELKSRITKASAPGLIWVLAFKEIERVTTTAHNPSETRVSDFAGHARYLRALCAATPFDSFDTSEDPHVEELLDLCNRLWFVITYHELLVNVGMNEATYSNKREIATLMSLLSAFQLESPYIEQAETRLRNIFGPFSNEVIEAAIGLSVDEIASGMKAASEMVRSRFSAAQELRLPVYEKWKEFGRLVEQGVPDAEIDQFLEDVRANSDIGENFVKSHDVLNEILLFRASDFDEALGSKAETFLREFSFAPGTVNQDFRTPFDRDDVRARPFARLHDEKYLLFDMYYSPFAPLYRLEECFKDEPRRSRLLKRRDRVLEEDARKVIGSVTQEATIASKYYLPIGPNGTLSERDLFVFSAGAALVCECKARPLRDAADHRGNVRKIESDIKRSVQEGYEQACSVIRHLRSCTEPDILFWNSDKSDKCVIAKVTKDAIQTAIPIVVLDSCYGLVATELTPWLAVDPDIGYPWVVHRDALESILHLIDTMPRLIDFLSWRRTLHGIAVNEDELVFAGFYLFHGAAEVPSNQSFDRIQLDPCYSDIFDADYFRRKGVPVEFQFPAETKPPVWTSMKRDGDLLSFLVDGKLKDSINFLTGEHVDSVPRSQSTTFDSRIAMAFGDELIGRDSRPRRNGPCPCGSGIKFKKCCMRD